MAQAWSFVAAGTVATGTNLSVPVPATYSAGNSLFLIYLSSSNTSTPTGWDLIYTKNTGTTRVDIFQKIATNSESSVVFSNALNAAAVMLSYKNISTFQTSSTFASSTNGTCTTNTVATTGDTLVMDIFVFVGTPISWSTTPSGTTTRVNSGTSGVFPLGLLICDEYNANGATTTARTATISSAATASSISFVMNQSTGFMGF